MRQPNRKTKDSATDVDNVRWQQRKPVAPTRFSESRVGYLENGRPTSISLEGSAGSKHIRESRYTTECSQKSDTTDINIQWNGQWDDISRVRFERQWWKHHFIDDVHRANDSFVFICNNTPVVSANPINGIFISTQRIDNRAAGTFSRFRWRLNETDPTEVTKDDEDRVVIFHQADGRQMIDLIHKVDDDVRRISPGSLKDPISRKSLINRPPKRTERTRREGQKKKNSKLSTRFDI